MPPWPCWRPSSWLTRSANHLVCLEQEVWGDRQAKRLSGLEVEEQLELVGSLHRQVGGLSTFEDLVHVGGEALELLHKVMRVGYEPPGLYRFSAVVYRGDPALDRKVHNALFVRTHEWASRHVESIRAFLTQRRKDPLEIVWTSDLP